MKTRKPISDGEKTDCRKCRFFGRDFNLYGYCSALFYETVQWVDAADYYCPRFEEANS